MKLSRAAEADDDLAAAIRHAARALQAAGSFPDDPNCAALADAARGRLKSLEGKGLSAADLQRSDPLNRKVLIETP